MACSWLFIFFLSMPLCCNAIDTDADALLAIKMQLGATNPNLSSWVGNDPCNPRWEGVICTGKRVTTLNLTSKGLAGPFPSEFGNLTDLQVLDLETNNISGPVPRTLSRLSNLNSLNLSANPLLGEFPESILDLKNLVDLSITRNNLSGSFPDFRRLPLLQSIHLSFNFTGGFRTLLSSLPSTLVTLSITDSTINSPLPTDLGLPNLQVLVLRNGGVQGPLPSEWGRGLRNLNELKLDSNNLTGFIPDSWKQMTKLNSLILRDNMLRGYIPSWISTSLNVSKVILKCNYFSGPKPSDYPRDSIKGNCFQDDLRDHNRECHEQIHDHVGCADFIAMFPLPPPPPAAAASSPNATSANLGGIVGGVMGGVFLCLLATLVFWRCKRRYYGDSEFDALLRNWEAPSGVEVFQLDQLSKATNRFSKDCEIGCGGFGKVYRGELSDGRVVAIKKAYQKSTQGHEEFLNEITLLSRLHHRHLVRLIGFCRQAKCQILVYEYMENGNLHNLLLGRDDRVLDWYERLEIAVAIVQGLEYLHTYADPPVIHRDLKPSNILLDGNMIAKISDFGISRVWEEFDTHVSTKPAGTAGYLDPEYFIRRQLTSASDVYGFGVILLELITGQNAIDHKRPEEFNLIEWVKPRLASGGVGAIIDPRINDDFPEDVYQVLAQTALECAAFNRSSRPSIKEILATLTSLLKSSTPSRKHYSPPEVLIPSAFSDTMTTTEEFSYDFTTSISSQS